MNEYRDISAGSTEQLLGSTGKEGEHLSHLIIFPATTAPGAVTLIDGADSKVVFPGGADSVSNLIPFVVFFGINSRGALKITTGSNVSVRAVGDFE